MRPKRATTCYAHICTPIVGWNTRLLNGRWVPTFPNTALADADLLVLRNIGISFGGLRALDGIDLAVALKTEIAGVI